MVGTFAMFFFLRKAFKHSSIPGDRRRVPDNLPKREYPNILQFTITHTHWILGKYGKYGNFLEESHYTYRPFNIYKNMHMHMCVFFWLSMIWAFGCFGFIRLAESLSLSTSIRTCCAEPCLPNNAKTLRS